MTGANGLVRPDPGASAPAAPFGAAMAAQLWVSLPGLLVANLAFLAWCVPYGLLALAGLPTLALAVAPLTVGPGLVALAAAAARLNRGEPLGAWSTSLRDACAGFRTGAVLTAALRLSWHAQLAALRLVVDEHGATRAVALWAAQVAMLILGALVGVHALALAGLYRQGALEATRNAFVVAVRHPGPTVALLVLIGGAGSLTWMLGGAPLVIVPAVLALAIVRTTQHLVGDGGPAS